MDATSSANKSESATYENEEAMGEAAGETPETMRRRSPKPRCRCFTKKGKEIGAGAVALERKDVEGRNGT